MRTPPRIASTLLRVFGGFDEGGLGDLLEEFQSGKSRLWYWRQVAGAIIAAVFREVCTHPMTVVVCILVGWFVAWEFGTTVVRFTIDAAFRAYARWYFAHGGGTPLPLGGRLTWIISFAIAFLANGSGGFAAVRWYRGNQPLLALIFALAIIGMQTVLLMASSIVIDASSLPARYVFQPVPMSPTTAVMLAMSPVAAFIGGMVGSHRAARVA